MRLKLINSPFRAVVNPNVSDCFAFDSPPPQIMLIVKVNLFLLICCPLNAVELIRLLTSVLYQVHFGGLFYPLQHLAVKVIGPVKLLSDNWGLCHTKCPETSRSL